MLGATVGTRSRTGNAFQQQGTDVKSRWNAQLSDGDLVGHLNCRYLTALDLRVANGELDKPKIWDPVLEVLADSREFRLGSDRRRPLSWAN
jgi:hypothetical protein